MNILLFIKDFELGSKVSSSCVDFGHNVEFCDEKTSPDDFVEKSILAIIDLDESVFFSVGLVSELKRHNLKIIGVMGTPIAKEWNVFAGMCVMMVREINRYLKS